MLQVPSTSQNQLLDQYDDMIQFRDGGGGTEHGQGVALCRAFPWFTILALKLLCTLVSRSKGCSQTKQTLRLETTTPGVFSLRVGGGGGGYKKKK